MNISLIVDKYNNNICSKNYQFIIHESYQFKGWYESYDIKHQYLYRVYFGYLCSLFFGDKIIVFSSRSSQCSCYPGKQGGSGFTVHIRWKCKNQDFNLYFTTEMMYIFIYVRNLLCLHLIIACLKFLMCLVCTGFVSVCVFVFF